MGRSVRALNTEKVNPLGIQVTSDILCGTANGDANEGRWEEMGRVLVEVDGCSSNSGELKVVDAPAFRTCVDFDG